MSFTRNSCRSMTAKALAALAATAVTALAGADSSGPQVTLDPAVETAARQQITAYTLEAPIRFLASDALEGRGPATRGDTLARLYLAAELQSLGYQPAGPNGSWEQAFDVVGITSQAPPVWSFTAKGGQVDLRWSEDYIASSGVQTDTATVRDAELVFVGYGIEAPEYRWDDFKGTDVKGKVLLMLNNDPDWDPALFEGNTRLWYGRWDYKYLSAARQGAAGAIIIHTTPSAGYPFQVVQTSWSGESFELPAGDEPRVQVRAWVTEDAARQLAQLGGQDLDRLVEAARSRDFRPVSLGLKTSLTIQNQVKRAQTANVAGLLRGSDPQLSQEVVVFTAHHDHLGVGNPDAEGDRIYNGAMDNGAGVAHVLGLAKAFKALPTPPRRSVLMLFVAAEEQGLLGSQYYAEHPTFPPGRIAANFNFDGGNVYGRASDVVFVGKGKSTLDDVIERYAALQGRVVKPDQLPDRGHFYRSDQFNFARIGVPAFYQSSSLDYVGRPEGWGKEQIEAFEEKHYHQPSDEFDPDWNYEGMLEDIQLAFYASLEVANSDGLPQWRPGDEFEAARNAALAAVGSSAP